MSEAKESQRRVVAGESCVEERMALPKRARSEVVVMRERAAGSPGGRVALKGTGVLSREEECMERGRRMEVVRVLGVAKERSWKAVWERRGVVEGRKMGEFLLKAFLKAGRLVGVV